MASIFKQMKDFIRDSWNEADEDSAAEQQATASAGTATNSSSQPSPATEANAGQPESEEAQAAQQTLERIARLHQAEIFACSLAAPFRASACYDWFSLFKSSRQDPDPNVVPFHLYSFGDSSALKQDQIDMLRQQQERSFGIEHNEDVLKIGKNFLSLTGISLPSLSNVEEMPSPLDGFTFDREDDGVNAWLVSAFASLLVTGTECNGLPKEQAVQILSELAPVVLRNYQDWEQYAFDFLKTDQLLGINKGRGAKLLHNTVESLGFKSGSPWVRYPLSTYRDMAA
ncbi:hypothetical protein KIMH_11940 [Bombiscardovia apis]|uniref:DUF1266 domain-containing protein n=1 Tax=Bombiscardovia apis TaxID=2932182 RepID=A0ABN6SIF4_9BIFI|nr:DUF1266 domain-containing protein [Bombiscardovia apis]BDR55083.1 hypothetical protein KIMH_11940 [Bombiscardovia apis]